MYATICLVTTPKNQKCENPESQKHKKSPPQHYLFLFSGVSGLSGFHAETLRKFVSPIFIKWNRPENRTFKQKPYILVMSQFDNFVKFVNFVKLDKSSD